MKPVIRVTEWHEGGYVATVLLGGSVVTQERGETKREARAEARRALEEMGLVIDGVS